jgi:hypothetical protein
MTITVYTFFMSEVIVCFVDIRVIDDYTNINKTNNHLSPKESLNSDGHQLH